ncbi:MAG: hypothetical protein K8Q97_01050 [Candidatus Andersenbacteria bacterium]|nr:hypothetical protein [Candidatus Andersenbacteria bacterium]
MSADSDEFIERLEQEFFYKQLSRLHSRLFEVDGLRIEVVSGSEDFLINMTRALAHVAAPSEGAVDLRIELHSGARIEFFDWPKHSFGDQVQRLQTEQMMCMVNPGVNESMPTLSFFDGMNKRAVFWVEDDTRIPWYEVAVPFRIIFHWFFQRHGLSLIHGASIGKDKKGIVLVGKGGSGKTSTALAVVHQDDLVYASDDYVLLKMDPVPTAISLYSSAKIKHHDLEVIGEKEVMFLHEAYSGKIAQQLEVRAIVLPVIAHAQETSWRRIHSAHALLALAPSTIFQLLPEDTHNDSFAVLAELVQRVPSFSLQLSEDEKEISEKLSVFIEEL